MNKTEEEKTGMIECTDCGYKGFESDLVTIVYPQWMMTGDDEVCPKCKTNQFIIEI